MKVELAARDVWQLLNGVLCVYKPKDISIAALKKLLVNRIVEEGNTLDTPRIPVIKMPIVEPHPVSQALVVVGERNQLDYTQHPLMMGRAFRAEDVMMEQISELEPASSGVCAFAVGPECYNVDRLRDRPWINSYRLFGKLGEETDQHKIRARVSLKAEWEHVTRHKMEKFLTRLRAQYKRAAFKLAEVDLQSQEAFELARRGAPRPRILDSPIVYGVSINHFQTPHFVLDVQVTGETDYFLRAFIHEVGLSLGSTACTKRLQRLRIGPLGIEHALLDKEFHMANILRNIVMCNKVIELHEKSLDQRVVMVNNVDGLESTALAEQYKPQPAMVEDENGEEHPLEEDCLRVPWGRDYSKTL